MSFGQRLRGYRELAGWSQSELAKRAGVPRPLISMLESGKSPWKKPRDVTLETARKLARALGVTLDMLAGPECDDDPAPAISMVVG